MNPCATCNHESTAHGNPKGVAWKDGVPMSCNRLGCECQDYVPRPDTVDPRGLKGK